MRYDDEPDADPQTTGERLLVLFRTAARAGRLAVSRTVEAARDFTYNHPFATMAAGTLAGLYIFSAVVGLSIGDSLPEALTVLPQAIAQSGLGQTALHAVGSAADAVGAFIAHAPSLEMSTDPAVNDLCLRGEMALGVLGTIAAAGYFLVSESSRDDR